MRYAILGLLLLTTACSRGPRTVTEVVAAGAAKLPTLPTDPAWNDAPEHIARMVPQDLVEPRLMTPSTAEVKVRSLSNGSDIAFRLEWEDSTKSDLPGPARMIDACAVQVPEKFEKDMPDPQMGQEGKRVQVTYWRADWQATIDGRGDTIREIYPNASIDHYPFEAKTLEKGSPEQKEMALRYAPARALGNIRSGPRTAPVEDLVASGPGTLAPGPSLGARAKGVHAERGWSVVISRKLPDGLAPNQRTHIAFAVWQGSQQEAGSRKMRTGWIPLLRRER
ncbi:MAG: ethylbenzene dehydrogenase-related protein [Acidobacteria bacterium]|nr:ethylbenzene dehydrogenase-related protein [Acidobacteriota bacterium]